MDIWEWFCVSLFNETRTKQFSAETQKCHPVYNNKEVTIFPIKMHTPIFIAGVLPQNLMNLTNYEINNVNNTFHYIL